MIQTAVGGRADVVEFVTRIHEAIRQPYQCLGHHLSTDASIGIALAPQDGTELDQLIKNADLAMYGAKADGRRTYRFFEPAMDARAKARLTMEQDLRQALADGGFEIHYQPLVDLAQRRGDGLRGAAALAPSRTRHGLARRIHSGRRGHRPDQRTRRMGAADRLRRGGQLAATCPGRRQRLAGSVEIADAGAADHGRACRLRPCRRTGSRLEITEAVLIHDDETRARDPASAPRHRRAHRARRFRHRLFLAELSEALPVRQDQDRPLLRQRHRGIDGSAAIVQAVVNIAAARNMTTTAEGVETEQQREMLRALGCTQMQGYLFSAPKPAAEARRLLGARLEAATAVA